MRENKKSILLAVISGIVACIVCAGVIFTFPTNKSNLKGNETKLPNNSSSEIKLGDTCSNYGEWNASGSTRVVASIGSCSSAAPTTGTTWCKLIQTVNNETECAGEGLPGVNTCYYVQDHVRACNDAPLSTATLTCHNRTYNGGEQVIATCTGCSISNNERQTAVGGWTVTAAANDGYAWSDGTVGIKNCTATISKATPTITFGGFSLTPEASRILSATVTPSFCGTATYSLVAGTSITLDGVGVTATNTLGASTVRATLAETANCNQATKDATITVVAPTAKITCEKDRIYNTHSQIIATCAGGEITSGESATNAGNHLVICAPDDGSADISQTCQIAKAPNTISGISNISLRVGETATLNATSLIGTPVTYSKTSGGAATLNGNVVTAVEYGSINIIATADGDSNYKSSPRTITVSVVADEDKCWCSPLNNHCEWRNDNTNNWILMENITTQGQCNNYSISESSGCFKKNSDNKYYWGNYGATEGYTYAVALGEQECLAKNTSGDTDSYVLRCPRTTIMVGSSISCTYETNTNETLAGASPAGGIVKAEKVGNYVSVTGLTVGQASVQASTSGGHSTNAVSITVVPDEVDAKNCEITGVTVDQPIVSLNEQNNNPSNSYYIVHVNFRGAGCIKNTLEVTTKNGTVSPSGAVKINTASLTGQYSFHVYPRACAASAPTAKLSNGKSMTGRSVTVTGDWKQQTGCFKPCGDNRCTNKEVYNSFLEADLANSATGPYYDGWNATDKCYNIMWSRGGCGGGTSTYSFCCVKNDGSGQSWLTGQTSKTCPEGYTIDNTKNASTCTKTFACYMDSDNQPHWTSDPQPSWVVVSKPEQECKDQEACFEDPTGQRFWGKHYDMIAQGYILITSIKDEDSCKNPSDDDACYINNEDISDYRWSKTPLTGYTKADGIDNPKECQPEACYIEKDKNEFAFGKYKDNDKYIPVYKTIEVDGEYKDVLIIDKNECTTEVPVGPTDFDVAKLVYVFMAILMACGIAFIYYSSVAKKQEQQ